MPLSSLESNDHIHNNFLPLILEALILKIKDYNQDTELLSDVMKRARDASDQIIRDSQTSNENLFLAHLLMIVDAGMDKLNEYHHHLSQLPEYVADEATLNLISDYLRLQGGQYIPLNSPIKPKDIKIPELHLLILLFIEKQSPDVAIESLINLMKAYDLSLFHDNMIRQLILPIVDKISFQSLNDRFNRVAIGCKSDSRSLYSSELLFILSLSKIVRVMPSGLTSAYKEALTSSIIEIDKQFKQQNHYYLHIKSPKYFYDISLTLLNLHQITNIEISSDERNRNAQNFLDCLYAQHNLKLIRYYAQTCQHLNIPLISEMVNAYCATLIEFDLSDELPENIYSNIIRSICILKELAPFLNPDAKKYLEQIALAKIEKFRSIHRYHIKIFDLLNSLMQVCNMPSQKQAGREHNIDDDFESMPTETKTLKKNNNGEGPSYIPETFEPSNNMFNLYPNDILVIESLEGITPFNATIPIIQIDNIVQYLYLIEHYSQEYSNLGLNKNDIQVVISNFKILFNLYFSQNISENDSAQDNSPELNPVYKIIHDKLRRIFYKNIHDVQYDNTFSEVIMPTILKIRFNQIDQEHYSNSLDAFKVLISCAHNNDSDDSGELSITYAEKTTSKNHAIKIFYSALKNHLERTTQERCYSRYETLHNLIFAELECLLDGTYSPVLCKLANQSSWGFHECSSSLFSRPCSSRHIGKSYYTEDDYLTPAFWLLHHSSHLIDPEFFTNLFTDVISKLHNAPESSFWKCIPAVTSIIIIAKNFMAHEDIFPITKNRLTQTLISMYLENDQITPRSKHSLLDALDFSIYIHHTSESELTDLINKTLEMIDASAIETQRNREEISIRYLRCEKAISVLSKLVSSPNNNNLPLRFGDIQNIITSLVQNQFERLVENEYFSSIALFEIIMISEAYRTLSTASLITEGLFFAIQDLLVNLDSSRSKKSKAYLAAVMKSCQNNRVMAYDYAKLYIARMSDHDILENITDASKRFYQLSDDYDSNHVKRIEQIVKIRFSLYNCVDNHFDKWDIRHRSSRFVNTILFDEIVKNIQPTDDYALIRYWHIICTIWPYFDIRKPAVAIFCGNKTDTQIIQTIKGLMKFADLHRDLLWGCVRYVLQDIPHSHRELSDADFKYEINVMSSQYDSTYDPHYPNKTIKTLCVNLKNDFHADIYFVINHSDQEIMKIIRKYFTQDRMSDEIVSVIHKRINYSTIRDQFDTSDPHRLSRQNSVDFVRSIHDILNRIRQQGSETARRMRRDVMSKLEEKYPLYFNVTSDVLENYSDPIILDRLQQTIPTLSTKAKLNEAAETLLEVIIPRRIAYTNPQTVFIDPQNQSSSQPEFINAIMTIISSGTWPQQAIVLYRILDSIKRENNLGVNSNYDKNSIDEYSEQLHNQFISILFNQISSDDFIDLFEEIISCYNTLISQYERSTKIVQLPRFLLPRKRGGLGLSIPFFNKCIELLSSHNRAHAFQGREWIRLFYPRHSLSNQQIQCLNTTQRFIHHNGLSALFFDISQTVYHAKLVDLGFKEQDITKLRTLLQKFDGQSNYQRNNDLLRNLLITSISFKHENSDLSQHLIYCKSVKKSLTNERDPIRRYYRARMIIIASLSTVVSATVLMGYVLAVPMITALLAEIIAAVMMAAAAITCAIMYSSYTRKISLVSMLLDVNQRQLSLLKSDPPISHASPPDTVLVESKSQINVAQDVCAGAGAGACVV